MKQGTHAYFLHKLLVPGRHGLRLLLVSGMIVILLQVISMSSFIPGLPQLAHAASSNPIVLENEQQGSTGWEFDNYNKATHHEIEGYASLTSVNQGGQISFMVSLSAAAQYTMDIYRMGYYPHGTNPDNTPCGPCGGRLMQHIGPLNGSLQANCPTNTDNTSINFGLTECNWSPGYTLTVPTTWTTGNYLVKLIRLDDNLENYITFVVRSDGVAADIVYSMDVTTWEAYNMWGGAGNNNIGYDLYGEFNDVTYNVVSNNRAYTVSFDRPYLNQGSLDGAGNFMLWDYPMIRWMESQGYDVTYVTDVDLENNPNLMNGRKVFMNAGHDEYYSDNMRSNLQKFISDGVNIAFFSANNIGNRIVWGNDGSGQAYRRVVCDKGAFPGSTTIAWRALTPPQPENAVAGVMQNGVAASEPFLVYDASSWIYAGTGLVNYNGTVKTSGPGQNAIAGLIGYEFDERAVNASDLSAYVSYEPPGLQQLGHSYVPPGDNGVAAYADTTLYSAPSGAMVFAAGTIQWAWGVDNGFNDGFCSCNTGKANAVSQQITANILNKFIGNSSPTPGVSLNPTSLDFGTVQVGTPSSPQTVTVTNSGSASLTISTIAISGTNASDFVQTNTCTAAIAPGANCTISVTFTPGANGSRSGTLTLTDNAPNSPQTVALTGTGGTATPGISFNPTSLGFGNQNVGTTSSAQTVTVTNSGSASLTISTIAISGTNASDFAQTNTCTSAIAPGGTCTISVTFTPGANGSRSGSVDVTDNAPNSPQSIPLSGTGVVQGTYFSDGFETGDFSKWSFSNSDSTGKATVQTGVVNSGQYAAQFTNSSGQYVYLYTALPGGPQALTYTRFYFRFSSMVGGTELAMGINNNGGNVWEVDYDANLKGLDIYFWDSTGSLHSLSTPANALSANTWYSIEVEDQEATSGVGQVWLNGTSIGTVNGNFSTANPFARLMFFDGTAGTAYLDDVIVSNTYNGPVNPVPQVTLAPTSVNFGNQNVGTTSAAQKVTVTNSGSGSLTISSIAISGTNASDFAQTNTCTAAIAPGANCTISVTFTPGASGSRSGTLTLTDNAPDSPQTVALSGTGVTPAPAVQLSPTSINFGNQNVGTTSAAQTVKVTNSGSASLTISNIAISGTNAGDFAQTNTCTSPLAPGANCTISITFTPGASGSRSGSVDVTDNAPDSPQSVPLSGTGVTPAAAITVTPSSLAFGNQNVGSTSSAQTLTVTSSGTANLTISSIAISGTNASDFAQTNTCTSPLAPGGTCTISVTFTPGASGSRSGSVTITDNAPNSPQSIPLTGTGVVQGTYFSDGFETGDFSKWSYSNSDSTGKATVQTGVVNSGQYAAQFTNSSGQYVYLYTALPGGPQALTYTRFYFRFSSMAGGTELAMGINNNGGNAWEVDYDANLKGLDIYFWDSTGSLHSLSTPANALSANTWYSIEVEDQEATSGVGQVWLNGTSIGTVNGNFSTANPFARLMLFDGTAGTTYWDDVNVSNTYNGPLSHAQGGTKKPGKAKIPPKRGKTSEYFFAFG